MCLFGYLWRRTAGGQNSRTGTFGQVEEEEVRLVFQLVVHAAHASFCIGGVDETLRIAQLETCWFI